MQIDYPLNVQFKKIALTNKITLTTNSDVMLAFAHQKMLKLKEQILLYSDSNKSQPIGQIRADKVIDFSPTYTFYDTQEQPQFSVKRNGRKSIWKADYAILDAAGNQILSVREDNSWTKVLDALLREIPIFGLFMGYFFNPKYNVTNLNDQRVAQIVKNPSFLESSYSVNLDLANDPNVSYLPIASIAILIRERLRG